MRFSSISAPRRPDRLPRVDSQRHHRQPPPHHHQQLAQLRHLLQGPRVQADSVQGLREVLQEETG